MGLKNSNSTVNDLKATFFDVFCDHTEELAALIEVLANDRSKKKSFRKNKYENKLWKGAERFPGFSLR